MGTPYKMKGFSGYGNQSPLKQKVDWEKEDISDHNENAYYAAKAKIEKEANKPGPNMSKLIRKIKAGEKLTPEEKAFADNQNKPQE